MRVLDTPPPDIDLELLMPNRTQYDLLLRSIEAELYASYSDVHQHLVDATSALLPILERPELSLFVDCGLKYESLEAFAEHFACGGFLTEFEDAVLRVHTLGLLFVLRVSTENLVRLSFLDSSPRELSGAVNKLVTDIKARLKALHWIPQHRPLANRDRDRHLWQLKRAHSNWSWGRLARDFGISDGAAELSYKRQARRERRRLEELHRAAMWLQVASSPEICVLYPAGEASPSDFEKAFGPDVVVKCCVISKPRGGLERVTVS
jgi:hypothetical protein